MMIKEFHVAQNNDELAEVLALFLEHSQHYNVLLSELPGGHELTLESDVRPSVVIRILDRSAAPDEPRPWSAA